MNQDPDDFLVSIQNGKVQGRGAIENVVWFKVLGMSHDRLNCISRLPRTASEGLIGILAILAELFDDSEIIGCDCLSQIHWCVRFLGCVWGGGIFVIFFKPSVDSATRRYGETKCKEEGKKEDYLAGTAFTNEGFLL